MYGGRACSSDHVIIRINRNTRCRDRTAKLRPPTEVSTPLVDLFPMEKAEISDDKSFLVSS